MVLAVVLARALLLNRLPKATFIALWALVAVRLLVPVSIPSPWSAASLLQGVVPAPAATSALDPAYDARSAQTDSLGENPTASDGVLAASDAPAMNPPTPTTSPATPTTTPGASASPAAENPATPDAVPTTTDPMNPTASTAPAESDAPDAPVAENPWTFEAFSAALPVVWAVGSVLCAAGFAAVYLRCRRDFATSLPVDDPRAQAWLAENRSQLRRPLSLRRSDLISTSLTYGVLRPVMPGAARHRLVARGRGALHAGPRAGARAALRCPDQARACGVRVRALVQPAGLGHVRARQPRPGALVRRVRGARLRHRLARRVRAHPHCYGRDQIRPCSALQRL